MPMIKRAEGPVAEILATSKAPGLSYDEQKSRRILRQGVYQHALVSPALAGMQFNSMQEFLDLVKQAAEGIIKEIEK